MRLIGAHAQAVLAYAAAIFSPGVFAPAGAPAAMAAAVALGEGDLAAALAGQQAVDWDDHAQTVGQVEACCTHVHGDATRCLFFRPVVVAGEAAERKISHLIVRKGQIPLADCPTRAEIVAHFGFQEIGIQP